MVYASIKKIELQNMNVVTGFRSLLTYKLGYVTMSYISV